MFNRKPVNFNQNQQAVVPKKEGCEIKVRRDNSGRIIGLKSNGLCSKTELETFKENISMEREIEDD